jgi:two-component system, cell cycle response regulator
MRVLIAEDDPISRRVLESTLGKWGYEVLVTCDGAQAFDALQGEDAPRLAVLDWMMPEMDGSTLCKHVREMDGGEYFYLILLTARQQKEDIIAGLEAGADDYVIKPFDARELRVRIRCGRRIIELQNELLATRDELTIQATHDSLTGLLNRSALFEAIEREHARAQRMGGSYSVVMVDLDHFKKINDTYGHQAGDAVIREACQRMLAQTRQYDTVGRYGGEEFLVLLPQSDLAGGIQEATRINESIRSRPFDIGTTQLPVTASLGVASSEQDGNLTVQELIHQADEALYHAKQAGRNRVCSWTDISPPAVPS